MLIRRALSYVCGGIAAWGLAGCTSLVNRTAFLPDRDYVVAADDLPEDVRHVFLNTADGERLEAFIVTPENPARLLLYFHGNAGNISQRVRHLQRFASAAHAVVLGIGYRGYGVSTGSPSERGIYRDGEAALRYAQEVLGYSAERIIVCGISLGSAVALHTAVQHDVAGVILVTPFTTGRAVARAHGRGGVAWLAGGSFNSLAKARRLDVPALVIHGTRDDVIPYAMGREIFEAIATRKRFVTIDGARHGNVSYVDPQKFWSAVGEFAAEVTEDPDGHSRATKLQKG